MKIWHLTRSCSGGAGQYALRLSAALGAKGVESTVLAVEGPSGEGIGLLSRVDTPLRRFAARGFRSFSHRIALDAYHSLRGPESYDPPVPIQAGDIVHLHGMTGWIGVSGLRRLIPQGARVFWTAHDMWMVSGGCVVYRGCGQFRDQCAECPVLRAPWKRVARLELQTKREFSRSHQVTPIANSRWMADRIRESCLFGEVKSIPIVPPIVHAAYLAGGIPDMRQEWGIPEGRTVICLGARALDDKYKGIPEFLEQLSRAADLAGQVTVLLFGPGTIEIPPNLDVRLLGNITDPSELAKVYRTSEVFVSPSLMETFGMTLAEAQACGARVIGYDVGGVRDAVAVEEAGSLVPAGDGSAILGMLKRLIEDRPLPVEPRQNRREWARSRFDATVVVEQQMRSYQDDLR